MTPCTQWRKTETAYAVWRNHATHLSSQLTTVVCPMEVPPPEAVTAFLLSSGRKVLEEKEKRPSCVQTRPCLTRNTSRMSPLALAKSGN